MIYDESLMNPNFPPFVVYIPTQEVLEKMMRACVKAKTIDEVMKNFI